MNVSMIMILQLRQWLQYDSTSIRRTFDARDGLLIKGHYVHSDVTGSRSHADLLI